jgi:hypothetical protein
MSAALYCESFSALLPEGIITPGGLRPWTGGQDGPADVAREQVLDKPYPSFGKLSLPDRLAFSAASLALSACPVGDKESAGIFLGLPAGSISTDLRYMESVLAGFPGPALFSATLPSSAIADVAIFFGLKGENRVIAGGPESGLVAFDCACAMLAAGTTGRAIVLSVNAVESKDVSSPLLPAGFDTQNRAYAFLLSADARPLPGRKGRRIEVSFDHCNKDLPGERGELYFYNLMQLLRGPRGGSIEFNVHGISGRMTVLKD